MRDEASDPAERLPRAVILGCAGERLIPEEARFFADADPLGFVLFRRNSRTRDQLRELIAALRDAVGRADAPVLIDQEGGRVARLQPPEWRPYQPEAREAVGSDRSPSSATEAARWAEAASAETREHLVAPPDPLDRLRRPVGHRDERACDEALIRIANGALT